MLPWILLSENNSKSDVRGRHWRGNSDMRMLLFAERLGFFCTVVEEITGTDPMGPKRCWRTVSQIEGKCKGLKLIKSVSPHPKTIVKSYCW